MTNHPLTALSERAVATAWRIFAHLPRRSDRLVARAHRMATVIAGNTLPLVRLDGRGHDGGKASLTLAGVGPALQSFEALVLAEREGREILGLFSLGRVPVAIMGGAADADLVVARLPSHASRGLSPPGAVRVPESVTAVLDISEGEPTFRHAEPPNRRLLEQVERAGYSWAVTYAVPDLERFDRTMYRPWALRMAASGERPKRFELLLRDFKRGGLLGIERNGTVVAARLFRIDGDRTTRMMRLLGPTVVDPEIPADQQPAPPLLDAASLAFADAFCRQHGISRLELGMSPPFLHDMLLESYRGWGASVAQRAGAAYDIVLYWHGYSPVLRRLLHDHPLIIRRRESFAVLTANAPGAAVDDRRRDFLSLRGTEQVRLLQDDGTLD